MNRQPTDRSNITRRTVLQGMGAALAIPWLEAMQTQTLHAESAQDVEAPVRMAVLFAPNGTRADLWTPQGEGSEFTLSPTLQPLEAFKQQLLIPTNLWNQASRSGDGHYVKTSGFLTCTTINKTLGIDLNANGTSMDQVAAKSVGKQTPLPSLELGIDPVSVGVDRNVGYTRVYGAHIAWNSPTSPLAREVSPRLVYERLYRAGQPSSKTAEQDKLLLDRVLDDARRLDRQLGAEDRHRLKEYLQSVRSIEQRVQRATDETAEPWTPRSSFDAAQKPPAKLPNDHQEHVRLMLDMIALAFQTDTTRVSTFMFGNAVSGRNFSFLDGVTGGHHDVSHHENKEEKLNQYAIISRWHVEQYAYLLQRLAAMQEGDSNVLANSMILFGSGLRDGNAHDPHNLPLVLAGQAGGRLETGKHLTFSRDTPLANLYTSMLTAFGCSQEPFADSTGPLQGTLA